MPPIKKLTWTVSLLAVAVSQAEAYMGGSAGPSYHQSSLALPYAQGSDLWGSNRGYDQYSRSDSYERPSQAIRASRPAGYSGIHGQSTLDLSKNYGEWNNSTKLDSTSFYHTVMLDDKHVWVIAFIDPNCPRCERFSA